MRIFLKRASLILGLSLCVANAPPHSVAQAQTDFYCEAYFWTKSAFTGTYQREVNQRSDNFRLRILPNGNIRITGSDLLTNGELKARKSGSIYSFTAGSQAQNGLGQSLGAVGGTTLNANTGSLKQYYTTKHPLLNMMVEQVFQAECE